jgi:hypothetical protein
LDLLLGLLEVGIKIWELLREDKGIWYNIEVVFPISLLHFHNIEAKSILSGEFIATWEMIDLLKFI